jgi:hypothetical protein
VALKRCSLYAVARWQLCNCIFPIAKAFDKTMSAVRYGSYPYKLLRMLSAVVGPERTSSNVRYESAIRREADIARTSQIGRS